MFLSDRDLRLAMTPQGGINRRGIFIPGGLRVQPLYDPIQPGSIELRLGYQYIRPAPGVIDYQRKKRPENTVLNIVHTLVLEPGDFVNVCTLEYVHIPPGLGGILSGKSMMARDALQIECAGWVDEGWSGRLTLELKNLGPNVLVLTPGDVICQLRIELASDEAERAYGHPDLHSHYQGATTVQMGNPTVGLPMQDRPSPVRPQLRGLTAEEFLAQPHQADSLWTMKREPEWLPAEREPSPPDVDDSPEPE